MVLRTQAVQRQTMPRVIEDYEMRIRRLERRRLGGIPGGWCKLHYGPQFSGATPQNARIHMTPGGSYFMSSSDVYEVIGEDVFLGDPGDGFGLSIDPGAYQLIARADLFTDAAGTTTVGVTSPGVFVYLHITGRPNYLTNPSTAVGLFVEGGTNAYGLNPFGMTTATYDVSIWDQPSYQTLCAVETMVGPLAVADLAINGDTAFGFAFEVDNRSGDDCYLHLELDLIRIA